MTMKLSTVKAELYLIAKSYPLLLGLMQKQLTKNVDSGESGTVGNHWASLMMDLDPVHFENVCDEFAKMERALPEPSDQLPYEIIQEAKNRKAHEVERMNQHAKYHQKEPMWRQDVSRSLWCRVIKFLLDVKTDPEQADQLTQWGSGLGDVQPPDWLTNSQIRQYFPGDLAENPDEVQEKGPGPMTENEIEEATR